MGLLVLLTMGLLLERRLFSIRMKEIDEMVLLGGGMFLAWFKSGDVGLVEVAVVADDGGAIHIRDGSWTEGERSGESVCF
jgi:hypothetical protein